MISLDLMKSSEVRKAGDRTRYLLYIILQYCIYRARESYWIKNRVTVYKNTKRKIIHDGISSQRNMIYEKMLHTTNFSSIRLCNMNVEKKWKIQKDWSYNSIIKLHQAYDSLVTLQKPISFVAENFIKGREAKDSIKIPLLATQLNHEHEQ